MSKSQRILLGLGSVLLLALMYQLQNLNFLRVLTGTPFSEATVKDNATLTTAQFIFNKCFRYIFNDLAGIGLIYAIFKEKRYTRFAFLVMVFGFFILLPIYLFLSLNFYEQLTVILHYYHRLVVNPTLLMLLIPAFFYQQAQEKHPA
jgi:exosortase F-associated protein